jgi:hypothetical protein
MPCDFGGPCECACVFSFIAREAAGASSIRHSLRPLFFEGARISCKTRAPGAARSRRRVWSSYPANAGHPVRRGFSAQSLASLEYWVARSSRAMTLGGVCKDSEWRCSWAATRHSLLAIRRFLAHPATTSPSRTPRTRPHGPDASARARGGFRRCRRPPTESAARRGSAVRHCPGTGCRNHRPQCARS